MSKELSSQDELAKARLQKEFAKYKNNNGISNREFAEAVGINPSLFSHYLNGVKPLTPKVAKRLADIMGIDSKALRPVAYQKVDTTIPVIGTLTNEMPAATCARISVREFKPSLVAIENNFDFTGDNDTYGYIILDTNMPPQKGDNVIYRRRDNPHFRQGMLQEYMRDLVIIVDNDDDKIRMKMSELAWIVPVHEFVTLEL
ncbi:helix-turn-helix domain-containing protein [Endozoicomonas ascidiicola]|uniref:helix-turn-helix domain-containing protein n=1 Tax=Endozoicomonas ascidiicola TaxID=1698521 RepID=UPI00082DFD57|nr:helix-turn-helix transcriptional regulator [Endozoicomonas ascidiicola]